MDPFPNADFVADDGSQGCNVKYDIKLCNCYLWHVFVFAGFSQQLIVYDDDKEANLGPL